METDVGSPEERDQAMVLVENWTQYELPEGEVMLNAVTPELRATNPNKAL